MVVIGETPNHVRAVVRSASPTDLTLGIEIEEEVHECETALVR
jgi:hypothetical protein